MDKKIQGTSNTAKSILKKKREMEGMRRSDFKAVVTVVRLWSPKTDRRIVKGTEQRTWEETHQSAPDLFPHRNQSGSRGRFPFVTSGAEAMND